MSVYETEFRAQKFATNIELLSQQMTSRLRGAFRVESMTGSKSGQVIDQVKPTTASDELIKNRPIVFADTQTDVRWVYPTPISWYDTVGNTFDRIESLVSPQTAFMQNAAAAVARKIDKRCINAFFSDSKTGETGGTTTSFPASQQVAVTAGSAAASGMSVEKLKAGIKLLKKNEVINEGDDIWCAITADEEDALLSEMRVTNNDYSSLNSVIVGNSLSRFMGVNFIRLENLNLDGSGYRRVPMWIKRAMCLAIWKEPMVTISQRNDLQGMPYQIAYEGHVGATRLEEKAVVELKCVVPS